LMFTQACPNPASDGGQPSLYRHLLCTVLLDI
jgi:hypothetical protein